MKNINWKVRFKKKSFWVAIVSAIILFINNITQALGLNYTEQLEQFNDGINGLLAVLVTFGVINDPTTKGMKDSGIAQTYSKPRDENTDPIEYQKAVSDESVTPERKELTPEEFDTSEPFTDDTDEVEFDVADYEDESEVDLGESKFHDDSELKDGKEDESEKADFIENIDSVATDDNVNSNKEDIDKVVKKKITKEVIEDKKESDK